jgi:hypothetical protein
MWTQFDLPTRPMVFTADGSPHCCGSCRQGRAECPHPMLCGAQLSDEELTDFLAEQTHDTRPASLADARQAAQGVADGVAARLAGARDLALAAWRALWSR